MSKNSLLVPAIAGGFVLLSALSRATTLSEDFSTNPELDGWNVFGNTNLFQWNPTNHDLQVTWDSAQPNSYFYHPLGTILAKDDDFRIDLDLCLTDIVSGNESGKTGPMEIAIGFLSYAVASSPGFQRGVYQAAPNVAELDYFPAGYYPPPYGPVDATLSPTIISADAQFATTFNYPFELPTNTWLHVAMTYTASNQTLVTVLTTNGVSLGAIQDVELAAVDNFDDFRVDVFSISSYSSAGDDYDSVLAHGAVDNLVVTVPPPPVQNLAGAFSNGVWRVQFLSRSNWLYTLERTVDFQSWTNVPPATSGNAANLLLWDTNPPAGKAFYRVRANRP